MVIKLKIKCVKSSIDGYQTEVKIKCVKHSFMIVEIEHIQMGKIKFFLEQY